MIKKIDIGGEFKVLWVLDGDVVLMSGLHCSREAFV